MRPRRGSLSGWTAQRRRRRKASRRMLRRRLYLELPGVEVVAVGLRKKYAILLTIPQPQGRINPILGAAGATTADRETR